MKVVGSTLVGVCAGLGTVPVALFTNAAVALLQKFSECGTFQDACAKAGVSGASTISVACVVGALGLGAAVNALKTRQEAGLAAKEFREMAGGITSIKDAIAALAGVMEKHGLCAGRLTDDELAGLAEALKTQNATLVTDGVAQRMMLTLDAAGLATADNLAEVETYVKGNWAKTRDVWEAQNRDRAWAREADARLRKTLDSVAKDTALLPGMNKTLGVVVDRLDAIQKGTLSAATIKAKGNLAAAKVAPNQYFTGRTDELARLHAALAGGNVAIVHALAGEGGIGKTELAKAFALVFAHEYDGVWWVDASGAALRGELVKVYEKALGVKAPDTALTEDLCQALVEHWAGSRVLIILDNVDEAANFTLFGALPTARVLATTRQNHKTMQGVKAFDLRALPIPDAVLLMQREIAPHRADVAEADLVSIATELDGHALAVSLAGAYLAHYATFTAQEVLAKLKASKVGDVEPVEDEAKHDALGLSYRRSVAASLSLSFDIPEVREAFPLLAAASFLHPSGITIEWLMAGTGWSKEQASKAAGTLAKYSIIRFDKTVTIHRLTQGVARSRDDVARGPAGTTVLKRLFVKIHALHKADDHDEIRALRSAATQHVTAVCDASLASPWAESEHRDAAVCHRKNADHFWIVGDLPAAESAISKAVGWADSKGPSLERDLMVFLASRANIRQARGLLKEGEDDIARAIAWGEARSPRDERGLAIRYASRASIRQLRGMLKEAEGDIAKSIEWGEAQSPRDERSLAIDYASRSSIRQDRGLLKEAEEDIAKAIAWFETQWPRDERGLAINYAKRSSIRQDRGLLKEAEEDIARAITWGEAQSPRDARSLAINYATRSRIRRNRGMFEDAEEDIAQTIAWFEAQSPPDERSLGIWYNWRASIRQGLGKIAEASQDIDDSIRLGEKQAPRDNRDMAIRYASRARILRDQALVAQKVGDEFQATSLIAQAKVDIANALTWWETNMPDDVRGLGILRQDQARIDEAARGV